MIMAFQATIAFVLCLLMVLVSGTISLYCQHNEAVVAAVAQAAGTGS